MRRTLRGAASAAPKGRASVAAMRRRRFDRGRVDRVVDALVLPAATWKNCPWQPREQIDLGLRQWLRCAGAALADDQVIGMPSRAVDEAWHGFILCTVAYAEFCDAAYGRFLHHYPEGAGGGSDGDQLARTVIAWLRVARPGEQCVLWGLDARVGVAEPWGVAPAVVSAVEARNRPAASVI